MDSGPKTSAVVREIVALALLPTLISIAMTWRALLGLGVFAPTDIVANQPPILNRPPGYLAQPAENPLLGDVVDTFIPWRLHARAELAEGRFPLWNPYNLLGTHFHANLQSQIFSPFTLLWLLLPSLWGLGAIAALQWTLTGLGMGLLLRRLGLAMPAAIFGSVALQLSGPVVGWLQWPIAVGLLWAPWTMWAALGWVDTLHPKWLAALSALVAAEMLAGHIETSFHSAIFLGAFAFAAWLAAPLRGRPRLMSLGGLALAALLGAALAAVQLLPFLDVLPHSYQWWLRSQVDTTEIYMDTDALTDTSAALMWLAPNGFGWPDYFTGPRNWIEANPYVGALTLLLSATYFGFWILDFGFFRSIQNPKSKIQNILSPRRPLFWLLILLAALSMAYGIPPLNLLNKLPGFSSSFNWRLISVAGPCLIVLAAMGLDRLLRLRARSIPGWWAVVALGFAALGLGFMAVGWRVWVVESQQGAAYTQAWRAWAAALFCVGALLILARLLGWLRPGIFAALAIALLTLDMGRAAWGFNPTVPRDTFYPPNTLLHFAAERGPTERLAVAGSYVLSNINAAYRVPAYSLYDATMDNRFMEFSRLLSPETFREAFRRRDAGLTTHLVLTRPSVAHLSAVGIKWVLTDGEDPNGWQPTPAEGPIYRRTLTKNSFTVWENVYARPFAYFAANYHLMTGATPADVQRTAYERMRALSLDFVTVAQIEDPNAIFPSEVWKSPTRTLQPQAEGVTVESYQPGDIKVRAVTDRPRFLVLSESWSPGWRAALDGQSTPIYRTNYVIQGVVVPPGDHTVSLVYDPPAFRWGVAISLVALVVWLALASWSIGVARRDKGGNRLLAFWRLLHPLPSLLTVLAAGSFVLLAARGIPPLDRLLHLLVIETAMQFSISAFNDYFDRHVDAGRLDKPVALGVIAPREAALVGLMFAFVALALSVPLGVWLTLLTLVGLSGGLLYDAGLKYTAFSWLPFAIAFPTLPLWAWAGASPGGVFPPQLAWVVPVGAVLVLGIHLADTIPDISRDTGSGVRGLAHRLGKERALALCWGAFAASIILTLCLWAVIPYNLAWYLPGLALGAILIVAGVALYLRDPSRDRQMSLLLELGALLLAVGWLAAITQ